MSAKPATMRWPTLRSTTRSSPVFHHARDNARERLLRAMDTLNHTFGNGSVYFGGAFVVTDSAPMRNSYTCIPKPELEEIDESRGRRVRPLKALPPEPEFCAWN